MVALLPEASRFHYISKTLETDLICSSQQRRVPAAIGIAGSHLHEKQQHSRDSSQQPFKPSSQLTTSSIILLAKRIARPLFHYQQSDHGVFAQEVASNLEAKFAQVVLNNAVAYQPSYVAWAYAKLSPVADPRPETREVEVGELAQVA